MRCNHFHLIAVLALGACTTSDASGVWSAADSAAVRATQAEYVRAWLADDTAAVLATLAADATLIPPRGLPLQGDSAIRAYWWPQDGSRTTIMNFRWDVDDIGGHSTMAYTRGFSSINWKYESASLQQVSSSRTTNLTVFRKDADGRWRIVQQMWGPPLP